VICHKLPKSLPTELDLPKLLTRIAYRINTSLERYFPEQRLFLKSETQTRFIRLRPATQLFAVVVGSLAVGWTVLATAILLMDSISAGTSRSQVQRQQSLYEERLNALSADRDLRADEASRAQERFNLALEQVSGMQTKLLASEDRRRELETGVDVIQNTLRATIKERDSARDVATEAKIALNEQQGSDVTLAGRAKDDKDTLAFIASVLGGTANQRDAMEAAVGLADARTEQIAQEKQDLEFRNDQIFSKLEESLVGAVVPLETMFRQLDISPADLIEQVKKGYNGQGGPLLPISLSSKGQQASVDEMRANGILSELDRINMYRIAAFKIPLDMPVRDNFRWTSGFGLRNDPHGAGRRMHEGTDLAGAYGTHIFATADGVVTYADWENGYGRLIKIKHSFGMETRFAHLSQIRVEVGQKVSRGDHIGDMGNSGRSTGTHLHYEIRVNGNAKNPMTFIKAAKNVFEE
jgi:murein DD-endopeptidase MepM/ murein hydrolase activator NlpD